MVTYADMLHQLDVLSHDVTDELRGLRSLSGAARRRKSLKCCAALADNLRELLRAQCTAGDIDAKHLERLFRELMIAQHPEERSFFIELPSKGLIRMIWDKYSALRHVIHTHGEDTETVTYAFSFAACVGIAAKKLSVRREPPIEESRPAAALPCLLPQEPRRTLIDEMRTRNARIAELGLRLVENG